MSQRDYYEILGVSRECTGHDIKKAYRKLVIKYHPDRNPGDKIAEERFKEAAVAYEVLSDDGKRSKYDRFGHGGVSEGFSNVDDVFSAFGDIFSDIFGASGGFGSNNRARRGSDLIYNLEISFKEAVFGTSKEISYEKAVLCEVCKGKKAKPGSGMQICPRCKGTGQIRQVQGFFSISTTCQRCNGEGHIIKDPCENCRGKGYALKKKSVNIKVPAGISNESKLRISGEGEMGQNGASPGDLYVNIRIKPDSVYLRDNNDNIVYNQKIHMIYAALGHEIEIETLDGRKSLKIPSGTQHGDILKIKGLGIPSLRSIGRGDFLVKIEIEIPKKLNSEDRKLMEKIAENIKKSDNSKFYKFWNI